MLVDQNDDGIAPSSRSCLLLSRRKKKKKHAKALAEAMTDVSCSSLSLQEPELPATTPRMGLALLFCAGKSTETRQQRHQQLQDYVNNNGVPPSTLYGLLPPDDTAKAQSQPPPVLATGDDDKKKEDKDNSFLLVSLREEEEEKLKWSPAPEGVFEQVVVPETKTYTKKSTPYLPPNARDTALLDHEYRSIFRSRSFSKRAYEEQHQSTSTSNNISLDEQALLLDERSERSFPPINLLPTASSSLRPPSIPVDLDIVMEEQQQQEQYYDVYFDSATTPIVSPPLTPDPEEYRRLLQERLHAVDRPREETSSPSADHPQQQRVCSNNSPHKNERSSVLTSTTGSLSQPSLSPHHFSREDTPSSTTKSQQEDPPGNEIKAPSEVMGGGTTEVELAAAATRFMTTLQPPPALPLLDNLQQSDANSHPVVPSPMLQPRPTTSTNDSVLSHTSLVSSKAVRSAQQHLRTGLALLSKHQQDTKKVTSSLPQAIQAFVSASHGFQLLHQPVAQATALHWLGVGALQTHQHTQAALIALHQAYTLRCEHLGKWHIDTIESVFQLGIAMEQRPYPTGARHCFWLAFWTRRAVLGASHELVAEAAEKLAMAFMAEESKTRDALKFLRVAVHIYERLDSKEATMKKRENQQKIVKLLKQIRLLRDQQGSNRATTTTSSSSNNMEKQQSSVKSNPSPLRAELWTRETTLVRPPSDMTASPTILQQRPAVICADPPKQPTLQRPPIHQQQPGCVNDPSRPPICQQKQPNKTSPPQPTAQQQLADHRPPTELAQNPPPPPPPPQQCHQSSPRRHALLAEKKQLLTSSRQRQQPQSSVCTTSQGKPSIRAAPSWASRDDALLRAPSVD